MSPATATRRAYPKTLRCLSALVLAGALAACGSDDSPEVSATTLSPSAETTSPATSAAASTATTAAAGKTAVNQTIVDDEMGHKITIKNVVRSFPIPERLPNLKGSKELVLVEVDITAGSTYRNTVTTSAFRIITEAPSPKPPAASSPRR